LKTDRNHPTPAPGHLGPTMGKVIPRPERASLIVSLAAIAIVLLAACNPQGRPGPAETSSGAGDTSQELASDFQIDVYQGQDRLGGQEVALSELLNQGKPVVLNFWAGLCPPCRLEMPDFQEFHNEYQDRVLLVGLDVGNFTGLGSREDGLALLQELEVTYPVGTTADAGVIRAYQVIGMPTTYFIKPNGEVVKRWTGILTRNKLFELAEVLLEASDNS